MSHPQNDHYEETINDYKGSLQESLDDLKGVKMPSATTFGKLQGLVPMPYSKFDTMDNPRKRLAGFYNQNDYQSCGFYNCKFYGNTIERRIHVKNQHSINK